MKYGKNMAYPELSVVERMLDS